MSTDDLKEFHERVGRTLDDPPPKNLVRLKAKLKRGSDLDSLIDEATNEAVDVMRLTQYKSANGIYIPTYRTVACLPPDVYTIVGTDDGHAFARHELTSDVLVHLPDSKSVEVIEEIERFWGLKDRFSEFGFSHRRGFLLWGPAGSGKTVTVALALQGIARLGGVGFLVTDPPYDARALMKFRMIEPDRPVVLIFEDIDAIIARNGEAEVLALLDGELAINNVVNIATTNYPENLDGRVVNRPSRFDKVVKIDVPSAESRRAYLKTRIPKMPEEELDVWIEQTNRFSVAHLKELIVSVQILGHDLNDEIKRLRSMSHPPKSTQDKRAGFGGGIDV